MSQCFRLSLTLPNHLVMFHSGSIRPEGAAVIAREPNLKLVLTSLGSLWIVNRNTHSINLGPGELFGFNTGSYLEVQSGQGLQTGSELVFVESKSEVISVQNA